MKELTKLDKVNIKINAVDNMIAGISTNLLNSKESEKPILRDALKSHNEVVYELLEEKDQILAEIREEREKELSKNKDEKQSEKQS